MVLIGLYACYVGMQRTSETNKCDGNIDSHRGVTSNSPRKVLSNRKGQPGALAPDETSGELHWPGVAYLKEAKLLRWHLKGRAGVVGTYTTELVLADNQVVPLVGPGRIAEYVDWARVQREPSVALDIAFMIIGLDEISRVIEYQYLYSPAHGNDEERKTSLPFYGCDPVESTMMPQIRSAMPRSRLDKQIEQRVLVLSNRAEITIPCVYRDLNRSIWLHTVVLAPKEITLRSERSGLRIENDQVLDDDGAYPER